MVSFLSEKTDGFVVTETVGGMSVGEFKNGQKVNSFDDIFQEASDTLMAKNIDVMHDLNEFIKNKAIMEKYRDLLTEGLKTEHEAMMESENPESYGTHTKIYGQVIDMFDNCVEDFVKESAKYGTLLPIKAIDFPILVKQQLKLATKDIMQTEVTRSPIIKKHIEQIYVIDTKQKKRYKYPQCFFNDEYKEIYEAGMGYPIKDTPVELPAMQFNVIKELTDADPERNDFTFDLKIEKVFVENEAEEAVPVIMDPPMRINISDNMLLGGRINKTIKDKEGNDIVVNDVVTGFVDFVDKTVTVSSAAGQVKSVVFSGYLSNEKNERSVTFDYAREEREWKITDGMKVDVPYTLEELEDTKALSDIDLYKKSYNNLSDFLTQMEDSKVLQWLDEQFVKYDGIEVDPLQWGSFITKRLFDCDSSSITTALPCEYIEKMLKFNIDRMIIDICDNAKIEDFTFVIYGNPRFISLLNPVVNWVTRPGDRSNGVKLDYGYGIMTSGNVKVQVVSTMKANAKYDTVSSTFNGLRLIPFPLSEEQFTFKHYKYTTHILTSNNSAHHADINQYPKGSYTYLIGNSRYTNAAIQGIQGKMAIANAEQYISLR